MTEEVLLAAAMEVWGLPWTAIYTRGLQVELTRDEATWIQRYLEDRGVHCNLAGTPSRLEDFIILDRSLPVTS